MVLTNAGETLTPFLLSAAGRPHLWALRRDSPHSACESLLTCLGAPDFFFVISRNLFGRNHANLQKNWNPSAGRNLSPHMCPYVQSDSEADTQPHSQADGELLRPIPMTNPKKDTLSHRFVNHPPMDVTGCSVTFSPISRIAVSTVFRQADSKSRLF